MRALGTEVCFGSANATRHNIAASSSWVCCSSLTFASGSSFAFAFAFASVKRFVVLNIVHFGKKGEATLAASFSFANSALYKLANLSCGLVHVPAPIALCVSISPKQVFVNLSRLATTCRVIFVPLVAPTALRNFRDAKGVLSRVGVLGSEVWKPGVEV